MRRATLLLALMLTGCPAEDPAEKKGGDDHKVPPPSNRIDIPQTVRNNLGITFVKVGYRKVAATRRYPGKFEYRPSAVQRYPAPVAGRVQLPTKNGATTLRQYRAVKRGDVLYRLRAQAWFEMQHALAQGETGLESARRARVEAHSALETARAKYAALEDASKAAQVHIATLGKQLRLQEARTVRLEKLVKSTGGRALELEQARIDAATTRSALSEAREEHIDAQQMRLDLAAQIRGKGSEPSPLSAVIKEREAGLVAASVQLDALRRTASDWHGMTVDALLDRSAGGKPKWQTLTSIEVRAASDGIVLSLARVHGSWVEAHTDVVSTVDPKGLRFVAHAPQGEIAKLRDGLSARVVPPQGGGLPVDAAVTGDLRLMPQADAHERTLPLVLEMDGKTEATWARAGVAAYLEVTVEGGTSEELAIPRKAVIRDGLTDVFFRRDPKNKDKVIRVEADLGVSDGRWVEVKSGLAEGNEVVVTGVYPLMLAGAGQKTGAGHFHADGTWHEGEH